MPSERGGLLGPLSGGSRTDAEVSDRAFLQAMLDAERALAAASARVGIVPDQAAAAIAAACQAGRFDPADLGRRALGAGNPVVPLVRDLTAVVAEAAGPEAARWVHHGATSQDILDTAASLVASRALQPVLDDLDGAARAAAVLADRHRATVMAGRTLGQQALPTTFGLKASGWLTALGEAAAGLDRVRRTRLAAQLGGAAGTLAALGPDGVEVARHYARELGLGEPDLPWHTDRTRVAELAGALGTAAGVLGKLALDVTLLAQTEIGEVSEPATDGRGGSSTLPHKRNPVTAVLVRAATARVPGLVATLLAAMDQEQERATGAWHAEWEPQAELLRLVGGAAARTRALLEGLEVHPERMRANLEAAGGLPMTERVAGRLAGALGRVAANDLVRRLAGDAAGSGRPLRAALVADPTVRAHLDEAEVDRLLDPAGYLGSADQLVDRALTAHRGRPAAPASPARSRPVGLGFALDGPEEAPVLVLANSMGTTMAMWDQQVAALAGRLRVLRYDHRGHGGSEVPPGPYRIEELGTDLLGLLDELGLGRVSFCGLSLGGMVGMWVAAHAPDRIDRLALCCTAATVNGEVYLERAAKVRAGGTASVAEEVLSRWFTPSFRDDAQLERAAGMLRATPDEGYAGCCEALAVMDLRDGLASITAPTLVLAGADDPATPPAKAEAIAAAIPGARLDVVGGAAHLANIEQPERVTRLLLGHFVRG
ncbi:MAG TPA: 3-carboxy-cis,cis-muconate cycloisomerase [Actinomycetota bacterium]|nr:3-carboxy-cis,cis-muconate cycloisomerase [Actinomycetota bacterium]